MQDIKQRAQENKQLAREAVRKYRNKDARHIHMPLTKESTRPEMSYTRILLWNAATRPVSPHVSKIEILKNWINSKLWK